MEQLLEESISDDDFNMLCCLYSQRSRSCWPLWYYGVMSYTVTQRTHGLAFVWPLARSRATCSEW